MPLLSARPCELDAVGCRLHESKHDDPQRQQHHDAKRDPEIEISHELAPIKLSTSMLVKFSFGQTQQSWGATDLMTEGNEL